MMGAEIHCPATNITTVYNKYTFYNADASLFFCDFFFGDILLMDEILHHLGWLKPYK